MMSNKTFVISLIIIGLIVNCMGFIANADIQQTDKDSFLITNEYDWKNASFNPKGLPVYTPQSLTDFYMPIAFKKSEINSLKTNDIDYSIINRDKNFNDRLQKIEYKILESDTHYVILYSMKTKASIKGFNIDLVPSVKGKQYTKYAWWNSDWSYYSTINIPNVEGTLNNFPLLVNCTDTTLIGKCKSNGEDVRFVNDANDTIYYYEIEEFTSTGFNIWVNVTSLTSGTNINMYYGNSGTSDNQDAGNVWDSNYLAVYHLNSSTTASCFDSTSNAHHGTYLGDLPTPIEGYCTGMYFDGATDSIDVPNTAVNDVSGTFETYASSEDDDSYHNFLRAYDSPANYRLRWGMKWSANTYYIKLKYTSSSEWTYDAGTPNENLNYYALSYANNDYDFFVDGTGITNTESYTTSSFTVYDVKIGQNGFNDHEFKGNMYEFRISDIKRTENWLDMSYESVKNPTSFAVFGEEQSQISPTNILPNVTSFNFDNNTDNNNICDNLSFYIYDAEGESITYTIQGNNNLCSTNGTININSTVWLNCTNCKYLGHNYTIWVNVTNDNITYSSFYYEFRTEECCYELGDNMEITLGIGILGIILTLIIFYLGFKVDEEEKKNIWKPILFFLNTPIALATGLYYIGNSIFSINWWIGIFMFTFAIILSMAGLYYGLNFGRR